jgi:hypothetical protein
MKPFKLCRVCKKNYCESGYCSECRTKDATKATIAAREVMDKFVGEKEKHVIDLVKIIEDATKIDYTSCYPIENFTIKDLVELAAIAKEMKVELRIRKETSNFYQGTLLEVQRLWDRVDSNRQGGDKA